MLFTGVARILVERGTAMDSVYSKIYSRSLLLYLCTVVKAYYHWTTRSDKYRSQSGTPAWWSGEGRRPKCRRSYGEKSESPV